MMPDPSARGKAGSRHRACLAQPMTSGQVTSGQVRVGCSGWQYRHWRENFYAGLPTSRWFQHYASVFDTVEINNSFYRLPDASTFARWAELAPSGFLYAVK